MKRQMRIFGWLALGLVVVGLSSCNRPATSQPATSQETKGTIAISVLTLTNPFFKVIADTAAEEAAQHGYDMIITSGEFDVARQRNQVKDFIVKRVAAIILCPCDSRSIGPAIQEANAAGIPVFTTDIACLAPECKVVSHIATDNYGGGKQAACLMIDALGEAGGKVVILDFRQAESCLLRVKGFKEVVEKYNEGRESGKIEIVAELPGGGSRDGGFKAAEDAIQSHGDIAGIFAINDPSALGARAALEKAGKADQVRLIGFDGQPQGIEAIEQGKIYDDPIQFPDKMGQITVATIMQYLNGEEVDPEILIATEPHKHKEVLEEYEEYLK